MNKTIDSMVDPFADLTSKSPDKHEKIEAKADEDVEKMLKMYSAINFQRLADLQGMPYELLDNFDFIEKVLTPAQISLFMHKIKKGYDDKRVTHEYTGLILSKLIQNSYDAGNNGFVLDTDDYFIDDIGVSLCGKEGSPIKVTIAGNAGLRLGYCSSYADFDVYGETGESLGDYCGNCMFRLRGVFAGESACPAHDCVFDLEGRPGFTADKTAFGESAKGCTFIAHDQETYALLKQLVGKDSRVIMK